jgi:regulatory protein
MTELTPDEKAYEAALTFLDFSARSRKELEERLARKKFPAASVEYAVKKLEELGLVNDEKYARETAELLRQRGKGPELIRMELKRKGIHQETVSEIMSGMKESSEDTLGPVRALAAKKLKQMSKLPPEAAARRLTGFLARRGYSPDTVRQILKEIKRNISEEI